MRREDIEDCCCMVFSDYGNALACFDYTPEALEEEARRLRSELGELTEVTITSSTVPVVEQWNPRG